MEKISFRAFDKQLYFIQKNQIVLIRSDHMMDFEKRLSHVLFILKE